MRYGFLSLLLLNILYGLWQLQVRTPIAVESAVEHVPQSSVAPLQVVPASGPATGLTLCITLGYFDNTTEVEQLRQRLFALSIDAKVQARDVIAGTDYWLLMPIMGGERHAVLQLSALQEQGLDSFLITQGEMAGQLSLGVFAREDYARLRQEQLQALGHEVSMHAVSKKEKQFAVEVGGEARRLLDQAMLSRLRADFPSLQHQYQPCASVANSIHIP